MQRSLSKIQSDSLLTQQSSKLLEEKELEEGSFSGNKSFLQRLQKSNLFRSPNQLKTVHLESKVAGDPYINWLRENSQDRIYSRNSEATYQKRDFLVDEKLIQKQKKLQKRTLPKIKLFVEAESQLILPSKINKRPLETKFHTSYFTNSRLNKNDSSKDSHDDEIQTQLSRYSSGNFSSSHRSQCYHNNLSKTQILQKGQRFGSNEKKLSKIHNNFYLNQHKKMISSSSFYMEKKSQAQKDYDLERIKGLASSSVNSFEKNLTKLEKKASLTCYNDLSQQFGSMKKQIQKLILQNYRNAQKKTQKNGEQKDIMDQNLMKCSTRIKTNQNEEKNEVISQKESFLPKFLMKSLILPSQASKPRHLICKKIQNLRI